MDVDECTVNDILLAYGEAMMRVRLLEIEVQRLRDILATLSIEQRSADDGLITGDS